MAAKRTVGIRLDLDVIATLESLAKSESIRTGYKITVADIGRKLIVEGISSRKKHLTPRATPEEKS